MSEVHFLLVTKSGRTKQPIHVTAAVIGVEAHLVRQWLAKRLFGDDVKGQRQGRERRLDLGEATFLRLLAEYLLLNSSLKGAWGTVLGLAQAVVPLTKEQPPFPLDVFAVETWTGLGPDKQSDRLICHGREELAACIAEATVVGRSHIHIINVSNIFAEVVTGWEIAALGAEEARREFEAGYLSRLPESQHARALMMFNELEQRITGKRGAPAGGANTWAAWQRPANVA
jgi:hypothetical protein